METIRFASIVFAEPGWPTSRRLCPKRPLQAWPFCFTTSCPILCCDRVHTERADSVTPSRCGRTLQYRDAPDPLTQQQSIVFHITRSAAGLVQRKVDVSISEVRD
jgi:hypothetical protein